MLVNPHPNILKIINGKSGQDRQNFLTPQEYEVAFEEGIGCERTLGGEEPRPSTVSPMTGPQFWRRLYNPPPSQ